MLSDHVSHWLNFPVKLYDPNKKPDCKTTIYRLATDWDSELSFTEIFERFTSQEGVAATTGIIIGAFHGEDPGVSSEEVVQLLVAARPLLPNLRGIFIGDMVTEENEVSWIIQSEMTPIFEAYPALEHFRVRGSDGLGFGSGIRHANLKSLIVESGGLPAELIRAIGDSDLPNLEKLEIWTGSDNYGGDSSLEDLQPFLVGTNWPKLRSLGLRDSEYADQIAEALLEAPVLERLEELDLSLGTLSDSGGEALLQNPTLTRLKKLDLHHHFLTDEMVARLKQQFPQADLSEQQDADDEDDRYVAVGE